MELKDFRLEQEPQRVSVRPETVYESRVSRIKGVVAIITWREQETVHIWAVISDLDEAIAEQIYEVEAALQETYDEKFDFYVHAGRIDRVRELLPPVAQVKFLRNA